MNRISPPPLQIIKDLQGDQQNNLAENLQRLLSITLCLHQSFYDEKEKIEKMQDEVEKAAGRVAAAVKISQSDQDTIVQLRQEIEKSWKLADAAQAREQAAQEAMFAMKDKLEKLQKEAEKNADRGDGSDE